MVSVKRHPALAITIEDSLPCPLTATTRFTCTSPGTRRDSYPLITPNIELDVFSALSTRCEETKGIWLHAINGTENHIHLAISIEPTVTISTLVGQLKGGSAFELNKVARMKRIEWQRGYGVVSFGRLNLPWVVRYINNQKEHHGRGTQHERLERFREFDEGDGYDTRAD